jgi:hypothetical protein
VLEVAGPAFAEHMMNSQARKGITASDAPDILMNV